ncbi:MAG: ABC transporter ATP-binding protein [Pseudomonadota bacterium]
MSFKATDITIAFGGVTALSDVSIDVAPGTITGLVGPNGAGKTTLFNCMTGVAAPEKGQVHLDEHEISGLRLDDRIRLGIARTFQTPRLDLDTSVLDAVMLGFYPRVRQTLAASFFRGRACGRTEADLRRRARRLVERFELTDNPDQPAGALSLGSLRLLEVARALASEPRYLLLDEPAAGVDDHDRALLAAAIREAAKSGIGVLLVEHNVGFVAEVSDHMVALVRGEIVAAGKPFDVVRHPQVVTAYLGGHHGRA